MTALGVYYEATAPSLIPTKAGYRVKTAREDSSGGRAPDARAISTPCGCREATEALRAISCVPARYQDRINRKRGIT